ncbi:MAG: hypothetical protein ACRCUM_02370 [Mycoplasmoidaceae bacterium]
MNKKELRDSKDIFLELQQIYKETPEHNYIARNILRTFGKILRGDEIDEQIYILDMWITRLKWILEEEMLGDENTPYECVKETIDDWYSWFNKC